MKKRMEDPLRLTLLVCCLMVIVVVQLFVLFDWSTGFRGKTLWDWLDLLIIPAVLALGALWANWISQKK